MSDLERTSSLFKHFGEEVYRSSTSPLTRVLLRNAAWQGSLYLLDEPNIALLEAYHLSSATDQQLKSINNSSRTLRAQIISGLDALYDHTHIRPEPRRVAVRMSPIPKGENVIFYPGQFDFSYIIGRYPNLAQQLGIKPVPDIFPKVDPEQIPQIDEPLDLFEDRREIDDENYSYALKLGLMRRIVNTGIVSPEELKEIAQYYKRKKTPAPSKLLDKFSIALARVANNLD